MENKTKIRIQNTGDKKNCLFSEITYCVQLEINGDTFAIIMNKTIGFLKIINFFNKRI